jgi:hypothetical protein
MVMYDHVGARCVQFASDGRAHSACSTGDKGDFAGEGLAWSVGCHGESL